MQATVRMTECDSEAMIVKSLSVPIGLEQLMESLTKEVLLKRPSDIYSFAYNHFNRLLRLREKGCYKGTLYTIHNVIFRLPLSKVGHSCPKNSFVFASFEASPPDFRNEANNIAFSKFVATRGRRTM